MSSARWVTPTASQASRASARRRTVRSTSAAGRPSTASAGVPSSPQLADPPGPVHGRQRSGHFRVLGEVDPEELDPVGGPGHHDHLLGAAHVRHRPLDPGQPPAVHVVVGPAGHRRAGVAQRAGRVVGPGQRGRPRRRAAERRPGQPDRGEPRRRQQRPPGLLGQHGVLEQVELRVQPAQLGQLPPHPGVPAGVGVGQLDHPVDRVAVAEPLPGRGPEHLLLLGEREVHCVS